MKKFAAIAGVLALTAQAGAASAGVYADDLTRCVVSSTSASDRISFIRWMFGAMSAHDEVAPLSTVTPEQRASMTEEAAKIVQRLILTDCREQSSNAFKYEGESALTSTFEVFGKVAMGDLMGDAKVSAVFDSMDSYFDRDLLESFSQEIGARD
jgi:hypothetical protein